MCGIVLVLYFHWFLLLSYWGIAHFPRYLVVSLCPWSSVLRHMVGIKGDECSQPEQGTFSARCKFDLLPCCLGSSPNLSVELWLFKRLSFAFCAALTFGLLTPWTSGPFTLCCGKPLEEQAEANSQFPSLSLSGFVRTSRTCKCRVRLSCAMRLSPTKAHSFAIAFSTLLCWDTWLVI